MDRMIPALIIITVFFGIALVVATVAVAILLVTGRFTMPGSIEAKIKQKSLVLHDKKLELAQAKLDWEITDQRRLITMQEEQIDLSIERRRQIGTGNKEET